MANAFESEKSQLSYGMGMNMGEYIVHSSIEIDLIALLAGVSDFIKGTPKMDPEQYRATMQKLQQQLQQAGEARMSELVEANKKAEADFFAKNRTEAKVKETASGLQYLVVAEGTGKSPSAADTVRVHYTGTLLDGTVFDSSVQRGEPAEFGVGQVIPGWTEALQLMNAGSKLRLFIPAALAYGERGAGQAIPPYAALIFDVELLEIL